MGFSKAERARREDLLAQGLKPCSRCGEVKPVAYFSKRTRAVDGLSSHCRVCDRAKTSAWYRDNREKALDTCRRWKVENSDSVRAWNREYREQNRDRIAEYHRNRYVENREAIDAQRREWRAARLAADPLWQRLHAGASRARALGAPVEKFTSADLYEYWQESGIAFDHCRYCPGPFEHLDHAHPLSREGTPGHVVSNVVPSCSTCNSQKKRDQTAEEYAREFVA